MMPRPSRIWAIARRDLAQELKGRRGLLFGGITTLLLVPAAAIRVELPERGEPLVEVFARGDVPPEVAAVVTVTDGPAHLQFTTDPTGKRVVRAQGVPPRVRRALDGDSPAVIVSQIQEASPRPGRSILFALISASVLTGAVSESIGGERSRRTLQTLLAAAITRGELVLGKWLAWSGYGAVAAYAAAAAAIAMGRVAPGWWLVPLGAVAGGAVALAMFLTRHAADVVGGATVSLRWIPAVISLTGVAAWHYGGKWPVLSSAIPIGGALVAAGDTWPGPAPAVVGTLSTAGFSAALLWWTARDLEEAPPPPSSLLRRLRDASLVTVGAALSWWIPVVAPLLWAEAGNARITAGLSPVSGVLAGALTVALLPVVRACRATDLPAALGLRAPPRAAWVGAIAVGVVFGWAAATPIVPPPTDALALAARLRLDAALQPTWAGPAALVLAIVGQEALFRGWLQQTAGPLFATVAFVAVFSPFDPVSGALLGGGLAALTAGARGSLLPAVAARLVWAATTALALPAPSAALAGVTLAAVALAAAAWAVAVGRDQAVSSGIRDTTHR